MDDIDKHRRKVERLAERLRSLSPGNQINDVAREFQKLVKLFHSNSAGQCQCITCDAMYAYNDLKINAGHYVSRRHRATIFDPTNCHPQCVNCNQYLAGNLAVYRSWMIARYGLAHVEKLEASTTESVKYDVETLAEMKIRYMAQCRRLMKGF